MSRRPVPGRSPLQSDSFPVWGIVAGVAAIIIMAVFVILVIVSGNDDDEDENDVAIEPTPTAEVGTVTVTPDPEPEEANDEPAATPDVPEATPTPEDETDETDDTDDTVEEETPTPISEPIVEPTPTPAPLVGDFGDLPSADIPSGSPADALNLDYNLDMSLQTVPTQAPAYRLQRRVWDADSVAQLAESLDIDGEVVDQGNGSFRIEGSTASLYITPGLTQFVRTGPPPDDLPGLPGNDQLQQVARAWLLEHQLVGADIGPVEVLDRDEEDNLAFVLVKPVDPPNIIAATPSAGLSIRSDGVVVEAMVNWPQSLQSSMYGLRSAESLWNDASRGQQFVDINQAMLPPDFAGASGTVTITSASISYTLAGSPMGEQYLVPIVVFAGTATVDGAAQPIPVRIYVQAVGAQAAPRG
jgi:hypothetical protein